MDRAVPHSPTRWLRAEGLCVLALSALLFSQTELGWVLFFLLFLLPDLSMLGYIAGPQTGAVIYNSAHTYAAPALLGGIAYLGDHPVLLALALIWSAHIGFDRMLGYGLKLPDGFQHTHLGRIGRASEEGRG